MTNVGRWQAAIGLAGFAAAALTASACFYDSRWFDMQQAQQTAVQNATPTELRATPTPETDLAAVETPASKSLRVLKVRARATRRYAAEVHDWTRQTAELVDGANQILGPTLNVRLELAAAEIWSPRAGDDDLSALSDELVATDPGQDVDWVMGLVGSVPRFERSFHQLGLGMIMGKHFVMRAMNDAREYEVIERELSRVNEQERRKLYRTRKRHKTATVFLHELAHTLGAPHEPDAKTIMHPSYDIKAEGYSAAAAQLLRLTLDHRLSPAAQTEQAFAQALLDHLDRTSASWVPSERDARIAQIKARLAMRPPQPASAPPAESKRPASPVPEVASLSAADQATFAQAAEDQRAGRSREAWSRVKPLSTAYPDDYAVQDLRCQVAMKLGLSPDAEQAECARLMQLTMGTTGKLKR